MEPKHKPRRAWVINLGPKLYIAETDLKKGSINRGFPIWAFKTRAEARTACKKLLKKSRPGRFPHAKVALVEIRVKMITSRNK